MIQWNADSRHGVEPLTEAECDNTVYSLGYMLKHIPYEDRESDFAEVTSNLQRLIDHYQNMQHFCSIMSGTKEYKDYFKPNERT